MMNAFDWFAKWALYSPQQTAVKEALTGRSMTYAELDEAANKAAAWLQQQGVRQGDRLVILAEFCVELVVLFGAAQKAGFILVPVNYRLSPREIDYLLGDADPAMVLVEPKFHDLLRDAPQAAGLRQLELSQLFSLSAEAGAPQPAELTANDPVFILYTSGTTGFPKGALYTHEMLLWNSLNTALRLNVTSSDRTLMVMPPFHTGGWNVLTTPFLHFGATVVLLPKFDAEQVMDLLEQERINLFMGVPTMIKMMSEVPRFEAVDLAALRYFIVGGEALPIPVIERWNQKGVPIRQGYGLTEVGPNVTSLPEADAIRKIGSIGFPNFYLQTKLVDEQGETVVGAGRGEFWLQGPVVTPGYWRQPEATAKSITDGWFHTGDVLERDAEGYLYVVDRIKNMFISGGENVYPAEIEHFLRKHPAIAEVAVLGVPDERWGEVGKAFVVLQAATTATAEELKGYCLNGLAKFKVPKHFAFVAAIPKNDTGKVDRKKLAEL
jgi:fatty-acyl-CoA synthase